MHVWIAHLADVMQQSLHEVPSNLTSCRICTGSSDGSIDIAATVPGYCEEPFEDETVSGYTTITCYGPGIPLGPGEVWPAILEELLF